MEIKVALIVMFSLAGGFLVGLWMQRAVAHHLNPETKDVVKIGVASIATLSALVLGLLLASTKGSFDTKAGEIRQFSSSLIELDRSLAHYGAEAREARDALRACTTFKLKTTWPGENGLSDEDAARLDRSEGIGLLEAVGTKIHALQPANDLQKSIQNRILDLYYRTTDARWVIAADAASSVQPAFLVALIFWLTVMFVSFGLLAPRNPTAIFFLLLCAIAFASAVFVMLEMDGPFSGVVLISNRPMQDALAQMGR